MQTSRLNQLNKMPKRINLTLLGLGPRPMLAIVRQSAPFPWRHPHPFGKHTPECRNRLVPDCLGHSLGADRRLFQLVGRQTHAEIGQQVEGGTT